jgi:hypothetical protein
MSNKKLFCKDCLWFISTVDGLGFCKLFQFLCPEADEACNAILENKENEKID